jgi:hypothetical protein
MMDLGPEARRVLELANAARTPSKQDKARVAGRVAIALSVSGAAASTLAVARAAAGTSSISAKSAAGYAMAKWWLGGTALLSAALGGYLALSNVESRTQPRASLGAAANAGAPQQRPLEPAAQRPAEHVEAPLPSLPDHISGRASVKVRSEQRRAARTATPDSMAVELELLHRAQAAWRGGEARHALALLHEHRERFSRSPLGLERDALEVLTLCEVGERARAQRLARVVLRRAPSSPMRTSIEESCAFK